MSVPWREFLALEDFVGRPSIPPDEQADYLDATCQLPPLRALHAASYLPLSPKLEPSALTYATGNTTSDSASEYILQSLIHGVFKPELWFQACHLELVKGLLVRWSTEHAETFLAGCDISFVDPTLRIPIITILLDAIVNSPYVPGTPGSATFMYKVASMPILTTVVNSLLLDTSNNLFPLCLRFIIALIPYAPQIMTPKVPLLMIALGRAVCWRDRPFLNASRTDQAAVTKTPGPREPWQVACTDDELDHPASLQPEHIVKLWVVVTYGAWPSNVLAFIREPISYFRGKGLQSVYDVDWEDVWPEGILAARAGPLLQDFSLHPDLIYFNSTQELRDEKRWEKLDPPELVSRAHLIARSDRAMDVEQEPSLHDGDLPLDRLQRENQLLRIEAGYAARQRKQYLYHLGRLHRHSMRFTVDEAEVHSFANRMKEQKAVIESLTAELAQQRREASQAQQKHNKWQEQLREKLAGFREEKRLWQSEASVIRTDLSDAQAFTQRQKEELTRVKNERFKLQNQLTEVAPKIQHIEDYEIRMRQLTEMQRLWDEDVIACRETKLECEQWKSRCFQLEQLLRAKAPVSEPPKIATTVKPETPRVMPVLDQYIDSVASLTKHAQQLEKENLQLRVQLERYETRSVGQGDRAFMWG